MSGWGKICNNLFRTGRPDYSHHDQISHTVMFYPDTELTGPCNILVNAEHQAIFISHLIESLGIGTPNIEIPTALMKYFLQFGAYVQHFSEHTTIIITFLLFTLPL